MRLEWELVSCAGDMMVQYCWRCCTVTEAVQTEQLQTGNLKLAPAAFISTWYISDYCRHSTCQQGFGEVYRCNIPSCRVIIVYQLHIYAL